jgi:hypothetical protein
MLQQEALNQSQTCHLESMGFDLMYDSMLLESIIICPCYIIIADADLGWVWLEGISSSFA